MTRKRNKRVPIPCADGFPRPARRPALPWPFVAGQSSVTAVTAGQVAVVIVVVVLTVALTAALVVTGMSAGVALELTTGGWLLASRLQRGRA
ncbi:hypothetical protein [Kitasatospora sp. MY 5-36]|uniref:hypothetical protein n=1 Tax=Kitasatospora sp. MY 5-36 TaxID=1678027 RepID=UPI000671585C|nr:hypothetical protein [Kitasatospora sp. MY 5-36]